MTMSSRKRTIALLLCVGMALMLAVSSAYLVSAAGHCCPGGHCCEVCHAMLRTEALLSDVTLEKLQKVFEFVMKRRQDKIDPIRSRFGEIEKEDVTLPETLTYVRKYAKRNRRFSFRKLLEKQHSKMQTIVTFLAVLELMKTGDIRISQEETFGEIEIESVKDDGRKAG